MGADRGDGFLQGLHALDQPRQFLAGDFIGGGIAGIDIGPFKAGKGPLGEAGFTRPDRDELRGDPFGLGAQEGQLVGFWAVERQNEQDAMIEPFGGLVQQEGGFVLESVCNRDLGEFQEAF